MEKERTYFKEGKGESYSCCSFCDERLNWCDCKKFCMEGYHRWDEKKEVCKYCLVTKEELAEEQ